MSILEPDVRGEARPDPDAEGRSSLLLDPEATAGPVVPGSLLETLPPPSLAQPLAPLDDTSATEARLKRRGLKNGRYHIEATLGRGAMGVVYLAYDRRLHRQVAVKTFSLPQEVCPSSEQTQLIHERFRREAQAAARLSHPGIVTIYDVDEDPDLGLPFIAMEYVAGWSLKQLLQTEGKLDPDWAVTLATYLADVLHSAHEAGIVHRDVKPANILVRESDGALKIVDFGVARLPVEYDHVRTADLTQPVATVGSPVYMAPEQFGGRPLDRRADLFSLAVVLYEALCGARPFDGKDLVSLAFSILHETPVSVTEREPELPAELDAFFERALAKEPAARFPDGAAFREALEPCAPGRPAVAAAIPAPARPGARRAPGIAALGLVFLVIGGWTFSDWSGDADATAAPPPAEAAAGAAGAAPAAAAVPRPSFVEIDVASSVKAGRLTLEVDGNKVYTRELATEQRPMRRLVKTMRGRVREEFRTTLEVAPGAHQLVARVALPGGTAEFTDSLAITLEPGETRSLDLSARRTVKQPVAVELQ